MIGMGYTTMMGYSGWWLAKAVGFLVGTFVFSYVFWWTKGLVEKGCSPKKKKK